MPVRYVSLHLQSLRPVTPRLLVIIFALKSPLTKYPTCRKDSHLLLTTLILGNMIVNEALPVITDGVLGGGIQAVVISTALVVM